jgi:hypothetical protein
MQRRNLVAKRLAAAGGHQDKRIRSFDDALDYLLLPGPKRVIAKYVCKRATERVIQSARGEIFFNYMLIVLNICLFRYELLMYFYSARTS